MPEQNVQNMLFRFACLLVVVEAVVGYYIRPGGGVSVSQCIEADSRCRVFAMRGECQRNPRWMLVNCQVSCGRCPGCVESNPTSCRSAAWRGNCRSRSVYMTKQCPLSCGKCCYDTHLSCPSWATQGYCSQRSSSYRFMFNSCKRSCRLCRDPTPVATERPTQRPNHTTPRPRPKRTPKPKRTHKPKQTTTRPPWKPSHTNVVNAKTTSPNVPNRSTAWPRYTTLPLTATREAKVTKHTTPTPAIDGLNHILCGLKLLQSVVGGITAKTGQWPWIVGIAEAKSPSKLFCGASLVSEEWIVTAAHCFQVFTSPNVADFVVRIGETDLEAAEGTERVLNISRIIVHPDFKITTYDNDIALLKLSQPVKYNKAIRPICIPKQGNSLPQVRFCYIAGWGRLGEDLRSSSALQQVQMSLVDDAVCKHSVRDTGDVITNNMFCGGDAMGTSDACQGDSGGPLICMMDNHRLTLIGIISWGNGCARVGNYGVYTKVSRYTSWIERMVRS